MRRGTPEKNWGEWNTIVYSPFIIELHVMQNLPTVTMVMLSPPEGLGYEAIYVRGKLHTCRLGKMITCTLCALTFTFSAIK